MAFGTVYFGDSVGWLNGIGILIVIASSFKYVNVVDNVVIRCRYSLASLSDKS